jgi:hypothetical protein
MPAWERERGTGEQPARVASAGAGPCLDGDRAQRGAVRRCEARAELARRPVVLVGRERDEHRAAGRDVTGHQERDLAHSLSHDHGEVRPGSPGVKQVGRRVEEQQGDVLLGDQAQGVSAGVQRRERGSADMCGAIASRGNARIVRAGGGAMPRLARARDPGRGSAVGSSGSGGPGSMSISSAARSRDGRLAFIRRFAVRGGCVGPEQPRGHAAD